MSTRTPFGHYPRQLPTPPAPAHLIIPARAEPQPSSRRVLIVDSDPVVCAKIGGRLNAAGHSVALACTRAQADSLRQAVAFDLAIVEFQLRETGCRTWIKHLVEQLGAPVIVTAIDPKAEKLVPHGVPALAAFLVKPLDLDTLARLVAGLLR